MTSKIIANQTVVLITLAMQNGRIRKLKYENLDADDQTLGISKLLTKGEYALKEHFGNLAKVKTSSIKSISVSITSKVTKV